MHIRPLSEVLEDFTETHLQAEENITIQALIHYFRDRGIAMVLLVFALPMALPIPVPPGVNIALASPLIFLTLQQILGLHEIWLPKKVQNKQLDKQGTRTLFRKMIPFLQKLEYLTKPRIAALTAPSMMRLWGLFGFIMALTVCIPVPLTNTVPSFGIALMSLGGIMRDGLMTLTGALIGIAWVSMLVITALVFGPEAVDIIKDVIKSFL